MASAQNWTAFASPYDGDFFHLAAVIATTLFRKAVQKAASLGAPVARSVLSSDDENVTCQLWRPELGTVLLAFQNGWTAPQDLDWIAAQLTLAAIAVGAQNPDAAFCTTRPLHFAGQTLPEGQVRLQGAGDTLEVFCGNDRYGFIRHRSDPGDDGCWVSEGESAGPVRLGSASDGVIGDGRWGQIWSGLDGAEAIRSETFRSHVAAAAALIEQASPVHYLWIVAVLREIIGRERAPGEENSSRSLLYGFGAVEIVHPSSVTEALEMFVHEMSHQYFHMATLLARLTTPQAGSYYSAVKRTQRPLERILLGYHAFANVALAYQAMDGSPLLDADDLARRRRVVDQLVKSLAEPLEREVDSGLTEAGRMLYLPLRDRVAHLSTV